VGTPGTTPDRLDPFLDAQQRLDEESVPADNRCCIINPAARNKVALNFKGLFDTSLVQKVVKKGVLHPDIAGAELYYSNNINNHTCGTEAGYSVMQMNGTTSEGATTLSVDNTQNASGTLLTGDIFTTANVNAVKPFTGEDLGYVKQHVVDADETASTSAIAALNCTPGTAPNQIYSRLAGSDYLPYQNVHTIHANSAVSTVAGSAGLVHPVNLMFHRDAFAFAMVPLAIPASVVWQARETMDGFSISVTRGVDILTLTEVVRFDVLYCFKTINRQLACRIAG
jgi:hypothetical protein